MLWLTKLALALAVAAPGGAPGPVAVRSDIPASVVVHGGLVAPAAVRSDIPASVVAVPPQEAKLDTHSHEGEFGQVYLLLEQQLRCNCGCKLDVHMCQYQMQCGTSPVWSARIRRELEEGKSPEAIKAGFVADFGPTVLMAPPVEGFNLVGYLLPAVAIVTAGALVGLLIRGGVSRRGSAPLLEDLSPEEQARLEAELRDLEEEERGRGW